MDIQPYEIILLLTSFVLSACYSGSEAALISIPVDRAKQLIEEGGKKGRALKFLANNQSLFLTTVLVGNNLVNTLAASIATSMAQRFFQDNGVAISVGVMTFLILMFGEITPKTFARTHAERLVIPTIRFLKMTYVVLFPAIYPLSWFITKLLGKNAHLRGRAVTTDDIEYMVNKAEQEKSIDSKQIDLLNSILEFPTIKVKDVMLLRQRVISIQSGATYEETIKIIRNNTHSRYPVCDGELDNTIGFLHVKDLAFVTEDDQKHFDIKYFLKPPFFVYEHMKIQSVFDYMNRKKVHLALVKDENGMVVGIITLEDIIEEIFGEITDEHDDEESLDSNPYNDLVNGGVTVPGEISLRDLYNDHNIKIPLNDNYSTLRGFLLDTLGDNFPRQNNIIVWDGHAFELTKVVDYEIMEVKITMIDKNRMANEDNEESSDDDEEKKNGYPSRIHN